MVAPHKDTTTGLQKYPVLLMAPDYDDATTPTTVAEIEEYGKNVRIMQFGPDRNVIRYSLVPRVSNTLYRTGVTSAY